MVRTTLPSNRNFAFALLIILMIVVGCFRVGSTYSVFSPTWDEPIHIAAGMELLDKGRYTYDPIHPPLARVMSALGLHLDGIGSVENFISHGAKGNAILQSGGAYERNLTLARIGILPFFIIASLVVALWAKRCGGTATSLLATLLFTTLPPVLAHAGLATLDIACAAMVAAALFAFTLWLSNPTFIRSCILGISISLAILSKFSALAFLFLSGGLIIAVYGINFFRKNSIENADFSKFKRWIVALAIALVFGLLTIWAGYRFSFNSILRPENRPHQKVDQIVGTKGALHNIAYFTLETPIPAPEFTHVVRGVMSRNKAGHLAYFMGEIRRSGWWYFYPIMFLVKTPLPFTLLTVLGFLLILKNIFRAKEWFQLSIPAIASVGILVVSILSSVDNGIRQILGIYPLLAIVAGYGASKLLYFNKNNKKFQFVRLGLVTVLLSWQLISSFAAHPDYLPYFNELARDHPEDIAVDSDLDWGQDLNRLASTLKNRGIDEVTVKYNGNDGIDLAQFNIPVRQELKPYQRETGWIAISIFCLKLGTSIAPYDQFSWLKEYQPVERVGKSIWLYYIPES